MSFKLSMIILGVTCLTSQLFAQTISINPKNVAQFGSISTGNKVGSKCNGLSNDYLKLTIQPSCYGANLRGGGNVLEPSQGNIIMNLKIYNGNDVFSGDVEFPNKVTWPENYGQTCSWDNGSNVECEMASTLVKVQYKCNYISSSWFLNDYLDCTRQGDPNLDGSTNSTAKCGFLYSWSGTNYAAVNSYKKIANVANCGLTDKNQDLGALTKVENLSSPASTIDKYAKRGKVSIELKGVDIKRIGVLKNNTTGQFEFSGNSSSVVATFYQMKGASKVALTQKVESSFDEFEECLDIKAAFIGANQFCGSYYSPLMIFTDKKRPVFAGRSSFPLIAGADMVAWPEKNAPGFFLALDLLGNKKIVKNTQLFGDSAGFENGFAALKELDSNKDNVIDEKDEKFSKLVLWQDVNGNGVSEESEVFPIKEKKLKSISLDYKDDKRKSFGKNAEARQYSTVTFEDGKKGDIIDIWFASFTKDSLKK